MPETTDDVVKHVGYVAGLKLALGICLCYTLCVAGLRGYVRWRHYGIDDLVVVFSTILAITFFGCAYSTAYAGLGHPIVEIHLTQAGVKDLNKKILASNLIWLISLYLSKFAIVAILLRTTQKTLHRRMQNGVGGLLAVQCIFSIALLTAKCSSGDEVFWSMNTANQQCGNKLLKWRIITALDIITEALLLFLPVQLIWSIQMSVRNKVIVITAFWLRIPSIVFSILRLRELQRLTTTGEVFLNAAVVVIWQAVQLAYSLAAVTIAALKRFTESLNTGFGHGELMRIHGGSQAYKISDKSGTVETSKLTHISKDCDVELAPTPADITNPSDLQNLNDTRKQHGCDTLKLRPEHVQSAAIISSPPRDVALENQSVESGGSEDRIIRQEVQYSVHYDKATPGQTGSR